MTFYAAGRLGCAQIHLALGEAVADEGGRDLRYALHDLYPGQFEELVVGLCHELLGPGVQNFSPGPDGGRDAKFVGTAQEYPSHSAPLTGTIIVQAKHTTEAIGKFSDSSFSGESESSTISEEIPRIKALRATGKIDHYILFSNRRLAAIASEQITGRIVEETGVSSVYLVGLEQIERYIKRYHHLATTLRDFEYDLPLRASPNELAEVITAIAAVQQTLDWDAVYSDESLKRVAFNKKNAVNGVSDDYARFITRNYLKDFYAIEKFLADPFNTATYRAYREAVDEFAAKLIAYRKEFESYEKLLEYLIGLLIERDGDLARHKRITRTVFFFMYWACDIGTTEEEANAPAP